MKITRWLIVGCGRIFFGRMLPVLRARADSKIVGLVDSAEDALQKAREQGVQTARRFSRLEQALDWGEFDAAYVATPTAEHVAAVKRLLQNDYHVLCEKPLAGRAQIAEQLRELADRGPAICMVAYMSKFNAYNEEAIQQVKDGRIGRIRRMDSRFSFTASGDCTWRLRAGSGGGVLNDIGIYPLTTFRDVMGRPPRSVRAMIFPDPEPHAVDESVRAQLWYDDDVEATVFSSFRAPAAAALDLWGEDGTISVTSTFGQTGTGHIAVGYELKKGTRVPVQEHNPYDREVAYFQNCIRTGEKPDARFSVHGALMDLRVMDAIRAAAESGHEVRLSASPS